MFELKEIKEKFIEMYQPSQKAFREIMEECNGKVMNEETCKIIEESFEKHTDNMINNFIEVLEMLKKEMEDNK